MTKRQWILIFFVALIIFSSFGCEVERKQTDFPDREIVFVLDSKEGLGFINPDGSGFLSVETRPIQLAVRWGYDGKSIALRYPPHGYATFSGFPVILLPDGNSLACPNMTEYEHYVRFAAIDEDTLLIGNNKQPEEIVLFNIRDCQVEKVIFSGILGDSFGEVTLSSTGILAIEYLRSSRGKGISLLKVDDLTELAFIPEASSPAWSRDGTCIAYNQNTTTDEDAIFVARNDGAEAENLEVDGTGPLSWSPDGEWLIYTRGDGIYKLNRQSHTEVKISNIIAYSVDWR